MSKYDVPFTHTSSSVVFLESADVTCGLKKVCLYHAKTAKINFDGFTALHRFAEKVFGHASMLGSARQQAQNPLS